MSRQDTTERHTKEADKMSTPTQTQQPASQPANGNGNRAGRKPGSRTVAPDLSELDLNVLAAPSAVPAALVKRTAPRHARSDKQRTLDGVALKLHKAWTEAGKTDKWELMPKGMYTVTQTSVPGLKALLSKAAEFHGIRVRFGSDVPAPEGKVHVSFAFLDKRPRTDKSATAKAAAPAKPAGK